ncbi:MAG TPA: amidase family protein, partial [Terracidiphilus sp.]|nr:amidase family protein [Terracidiphilus sp.]
MDNLTHLTIEGIHGLLARREASAEEIARAHIERIKRDDQNVRSYLSTCEDKATEQARAVDRRIAAGEPLLPLSGVPVAVKDVLLTRGLKTTCASKML